MNAGPGVLVAGNTVQGFNMVNNTIQWNNHIFPYVVGGGNTGAAEFTVSGVIQGGCVVEGNYFEADNFPGNASGSTMPFNQSTGLLACTRTLPNNFYLSGNWTPLSFTASQLPSCSATSQQTNHATANVSDATACTNGTSLTGGGSNNCVVVCKGVEQHLDGNRQRLVLGDGCEAQSKGETPLRRCFRRTCAARAHLR
jgi:hypothetical protein